MQNQYLTIHLIAFQTANKQKIEPLGRVDNCAPRLRASACPRHPGDTQVKNKAKLRALIH